MSAQVRVAVNLLWCAPGRVGGSEEYLTRQLLGVAALRAARTADEFEIEVYASGALQAAHPDLAKLFEMRGPRWSLNSQPLRILTEHSWLAAASRGADLFHHGGGTTPLIGGRPRLVTLHDLQYRRYPEYFSRLRLRYLQQIVPRSVDGAAMVLVPSEYVRSRVIEEFSVAADCVRVVPHGCDPPTGLVADPEDLRSRYGLGQGRVLVYPAITHPHKNHALLLTAMARYWSDPDLRLVLIGGKGSAEDEVVQKIAELNLSDRVVRPGRVSAADRDGLIAMADALVFPSRYEGFGAPLVEAMALGTPVVACGLTAISEVVGDAGRLLPDDPEAWADLPAWLESEPQQRAELVAAGRRRSAHFSLQNSATSLLSAYRTAHQMRVVK